MRRREPPRVVGPNPERGKWRVVLGGDGKRKSLFLDTEAEALRAKAEMERTTLRPASRRIGDVIDLWEQEMLRRATIKPESAQHQSQRVRLFLAPLLDADIASLTPPAASSRGRPGKVASASTRSVT